MPYELPALKKLHTICENHNLERIVRKTNEHANGDKELIARMEIKDHKATFQERPTDNKIDMYVN